eukprot:jgi/Picsp_1/6828/NSC_04166-R1_protein
MNRCEDLRVLDLSLLTVPFEGLRKKTRDRKYVIDDLTKALDLVCKTEDAGSLNEIDVESKRYELMLRLEKCIEELKSMQRKVDTIAEAEGLFTQECASRCTHLIKLGRPGRGLSYLDWSSNRFRILTADYMMRRGYIESAMLMLRDAGPSSKKMAEQTTPSLQNPVLLVDVDVYTRVSGLVRDLRNRDCTSALSWCAQNAAKLRKSRSKLQFCLHRQVFIELVRNDNVQEAIQYAKHNLSSFAATYPEEFQQAAALIAMRLIPGSFTCTALFDEQGWEELIDMLRAAMFTIYGLPDISPLKIHIEAGLSALKTTEGMEGKGGQNNPLRQPILAEFAQQLPESKRSISKLVCPVSGTIMEGSNPPVALPNGYVYGEATIPELTKSIPTGEEPATVTCPHTQETFSANDTKRIYIV